MQRVLNSSFFLFNFFWNYLCFSVPAYLSHDPPVLLHPERVVPLSESERFERSYQPNVALAPRSTVLDQRRTEVGLVFLFLFKLKYFINYFVFKIFCSVKKKINKSNCKIQHPKRYFQQLVVCKLQQTAALCFKLHSQDSITCLVNKYMPA